MNDLANYNTVPCAQSIPEITYDMIRTNNDIIIYVNYQPGPHPQSKSLLDVT